MSNPLYAFPAVMRTDLAGAGALPGAHRVQLAGRIDQLPGHDRHDRAHAGRVHAARLSTRRPRRVSHRQPRRHLVRRRRRAIVAAGDHLAASAGFAGRPAVSAGRFRSADAGGRRRHVPRSRRRTRRQGIGPENRLHARPRRLRRRSAAGDRGRRQRHRAQFRRSGRYRHAELHRGHDRQIQGRVAPSPPAKRIRQCDPGRFRNSG